MKKLLTSMAIALLAVSIFAASNDTAQIKIKGNVDSIPYSLQLAYGETKNTATVIGIEDYPIQNADSEDFDLTSNGNTYLFFVSLSGNQNYVPTIDISIDAGAFLPNETGTFKPTDKVAVSQFNVENMTMSAGLHQNDTVKKFALRWNGNSELTAGKYQSDVTVTYTVD